MKLKWLEVFIILMLIPIICYGQEINDKYSYQAYPYHDLSFKDIKAEEFNNTTIIGSCFYQEWQEGDVEVVKDIFPDGMVGVTFKKCNLDNVYIPPGNTVMDGSNKKIKVQNDWDDWILDITLKPIEPMNKQQRIEVNMSYDPKDIPKKKFTEEERKQFEESIFNITAVIIP